MSERKTALLVDGVREEEPIVVAAFREAVPTGTIIASSSFDDQFMAITEALRTPPSLLVVDLSITADGPEHTLKEIQSLTRLALVPKVILLPPNPPIAPERCYQAGMQSVLLKSTDHKELHEQVLTLFTYWMGVNIPSPRSL